MLLKSRLAHAEDARAGFPGQKKPGSAEMALSAAMDITSETPAIIEFGHFRVVPRRRELLADGLPIYLGGRSFDVLMALIEASGAVVGKDALMDRVWPNRVEENSLHVQISALRNAFGADRQLIRTLSGRGYQFTGEVRMVAASPGTQVAGTAVQVPPAARPQTNLPEPVSELIGRDVEFEEVLGLTAAHRLVTLTGAGGIGKTRLGLDVARHLLPKFGASWGAAGEPGRSEWSPPPRGRG